MEAGPAFVLLGRVACRTFRCPLVRCCVPTPGQDSSSRKTVWIKEERVMGWGCSECAWVFNPSGPPIGKTLDQMTRNFHAQLSEEFASMTVESASEPDVPLTDSD